MVLEMAGIPSAVFIFDDDLANELEIEDFLETEDNSCKLLLLLDNKKQNKYY